MSEANSKTPPVSSTESTTVTIVGISNLAPPDSRELTSYSVTTYTVPSESTKTSNPLNEAAVRVGNSLLDAHVPESAILRDRSEDF
jgi:hypothetical protein